MNPNSSHQLWSRWTAIVTVPFHTSHPMHGFQDAMLAATARWYRKQFGSATELRLTCRVARGATHFTIECRTEGAPASEPDFRKRRMAEIAAFFGQALQRYGKVDVRVDVHIEAGDAGDGKPPAQLILAPALSREGAGDHGQQ